MNEYSFESLELHLFLPVLESNLKPCCGKSLESAMGLFAVKSYNPARL